MVPVLLAPPPCAYAGTIDADTTSKAERPAIQDLMCILLVRDRLGPQVVGVDVT